MRALIAPLQNRARQQADANPDRASCVSEPRASASGCGRALWRSIQPSVRSTFVRHMPSAGWNLKPAPLHGRLEALFLRQPISTPFTRLLIAPLVFVGFRDDPR